MNDLVQTVRQLNWEVRPKINSTPGGSDPGSPLHGALSAIRDNEIATSQLIRSMSLAESIEASTGRVVEHGEASTIGSRQLLSEFATAREAILSILRNLTDEEWSATHTTYDGEKTFEGIVDGLVESDKSHVSQILSAAS